MKKNSLLVALTVLLFISCNKNNGGDYYFTFKENGINKSYSANIYAGADTTAPYIELMIIGSNSMTFDEVLGFYINNSPGQTAIVTGLYEDTTPNFTLLSTYSKGTTDYESGQSVAEEAVANNITLTNHLKLTITSLDSKVVEGTFSGDYYTDGNVVSGTRITITDGSFRVRRIQ